MKVAINIMLVGIILSLLVSVSVSGATWCDNDYVKRINVSVNNTGGSALTDYQVYVNLSTNPINETSLCVYNSTSCTLRPHWTENETGGNSYGVWINYSAIAASTWTNNTAIYYENAAASSTSEGTNTFLFFDDFEGGWDRYASNPIFLKNGTGWERDSVYVPRIIKYHNGTAYQDGSNQYYMIYSGGTQEGTASGSIDQGGLAYSTDLYNWTREGTNPVLALGGSYDAGDVVPITVLIDDSGVFHAWYEANSVLSGSDYVKIAYANSTDAVNWTKYSGNPILSQGSGDDSQDLYAPAVMLDGSTWKMWYTGHNAAGEYEMMYATAPNPWGPWTKYSDSYIMENSANYISPSEVWKESSTYYMTYYADGNDIDVASSSDGINWTEMGSTLVKTTGWESLCVYWASQVNISGTWHNYYAGSTATEASIGIATSDEKIKLFTTKWENTYGTLTETGGYLDYIPKSGWFTSARSSYTPTAAGSWVMETLTSVTVDNVNDHITVGQVGTDNAGGPTPFLLAGQAYGANITKLRTNNGTGVDTAIGTVPYNSWYNTNRIFEVRKTNGSAEAKIYDSDRNLLGSATDTTHVPDITNPLGVYGAEYNGLHIRLYWFFVRKYSSSEPAVTLGSEEDAPATTPVISNITNGSISPTSQYIDWDVNQTAHNRVLYSNQSDLTPAYYSSWENTTNAPNITLSGLDASTQYWYQVWSYNTTNTSLSDNSSTLSFTTTSVDTSFTVTLPSGYTYLKFEPPNSTAQNVTPNGQTDSQEFYNVTNTGDVNLDIKMQLQPEQNESGIWYMDEGTGTWINDSSGNNNNGMWYGNITANWTTDTPFGSGYALDFDGKDDYVNCSNDASLNITGDITIEAWIKPNSVGMYEIITDRHAPGDINYEFRINASTLELCWYNAGWAIWSSSSAVISTNIWQHVAVTHTTGNPKLYVNSVEKTGYWQTGSDRAMIANDKPTFIGKNGESNGFFNGTIDNVQIYNRNLSAAEIYSHYKNWFKQTPYNTTLKADTDNNPVGAKEVNTTLVTIYSNLATTNSADIWLWSDFSHTVEQDTNKTINVNVTQST